MQVLFHICHQRALEEGFLRKGTQPCKVAIRIVNCSHAATHIRQLRSSSVGRPWLSGVLSCLHLTRLMNAGLPFPNVMQGCAVSCLP